MKNYLILLFCILQSCSSTAQNDSLCEKYNVKSAELIYEFDMYEDASKLDSALYYVELALSTCPLKYQANLAGRKLSILSFKHDYEVGIQYITTINDTLFGLYPYYKTVILKRFYAMKSLYEGDTIQRDQYVRSIIEDIEPFVIENQAGLDAMGTDELSMILKNTLVLVPMQYYYYKSILEDPIIFARELDSLRQKGYNPKYIEMIKSICEEDFLIFPGY